MSPCRLPWTLMETGCWTHPDQADADGDGLGDLCDASSGNPDGDADGRLDGTDNCPAVANPEQADANINGTGDACDPADTDGEGFSDRVEYFAGTSRTLACGVDAWPADLNNDGYSDGTDIVAMAGSFGLSVPPAPARHNLAPDPPDGFVDGTDLTRIGNFFGQSCAGP